MDNTMILRIHRVGTSPIRQSCWASHTGSRRYGISLYHNGSPAEPALLAGSLNGQGHREIVYLLNASPGPKQGRSRLPEMYNQSSELNLDRRANLQQSGST